MTDQNNESRAQTALLFVLGIVLGAMSLGVAWAGTVALAGAGDATFADICHAVGGTTIVGSGHDVCADDFGQILILDIGAGVQ